MGRLPLALLAVAVLLAGCGGADNSDKDPTAQVPATGGLREKVRAAQAVTAADFPAAGGRTLQQVADSAGSAGPELGMASSVFTPGQNRIAFGMIDSKAGFVYGKTALYVAPTPGAPAEGPFAAPADVLLTEARYRSKQAATEADPFAAVYAAQVPFTKPGKYSVLAVTKDGGEDRRGAPARSTSSTQGRRPDPRGRRAAPKVADRHARPRPRATSPRSTRASRPSDMHDKSFADVVGKKPVALLFATPQLCQSRVCGPVTDIGAADEVASTATRWTSSTRRSTRTTTPTRACASRCRQFNLRTEPWLFVVGKDGQHHRPPRGLVRRERSRTRQDRPVSDGRGAATAPPLVVPGVGAAHGLVQRSSLPIPRVAVRRGRRRPCSCVSFVALAALWPQPRLEHDGLAAAAGRVGRVLGSRRSRSLCGAIGVAAARVRRSWPATSGPARRWTTSRRRSS